MTLLILAMGVSFCPDEEGCEGKEKMEVSKADHEQKEASDLCGPFCHCARCSFSIILPETLIQVKPLFLDRFKFSALSKRALYDVSFSIWQPPKHS